ncbi:hypothetical protein MSAN_00209900 [Mycena sanguinolenta]|uniref:Uncharacterized protein n=1 Tax=Mycena sanguinolenta TaxID=230812 RepID=A0A8H7DMJ4_9AGAR|nr:hypothetical protein MSAN_00209900 [Mycena sanguinolenta]
MFTGTKSVLACASIFLALAAQTSGHAMPSIALGVKGTPQRSDVQRPSTASPCGTVAIASNLDTSTAIPAAADGTVTMNVQNFNAGADGSTSVSVQVDETGVGNKFIAGTVKTNGNPNPTKVETDKVVFSLPAGTKCSGGEGQESSVKTTAGFGACTVVSQQAAAQPPAAKATTTKAAAVKATTTTTKAAAVKAATTTQAAKAAATTAAAKAKTGGKKHHHHHKGKKAAVNKQAVKNRMIETVEMREYEEVVAREFEERNVRDVDEFELEARDDSSFLTFARDD